ncbi:MAG: helix-turn-helix domain-containing protein, partial [Acidimicrobiales bacterium]
SLDKATDGQGPAEPGQPEDAGIRELTAARELRALTHPVRLALLEVLSLHGPLTATEAGRLIGESSTTCSFHLRQLAKYRFIEEAGPGPGRRRPWRLAGLGVQFAALGSDVESTIAASALESLLVRRWIERHEAFARARHAYPAEWQEAAGVTEHLLWVTAAELVGIRGELMAISERFRSRNSELGLRPAGAKAVETIFFSHPMPPGGEAEGGIG